MTLQQDIAACRLCAERFAQTATQHAPRPVPWFDQSARIQIAGQAPGMRVHDSGRPFDDRSGDRLRAWLGLSSEMFYDRQRIAITPAAFCFPGYDAKGSDLPPPKICAATWHPAVSAHLCNIRLRIIIGGYAHKLHLGKKTSVTETVRQWRDEAPDVFVLPHPSWRNTGWLKRNPWFEADLLPALREAVAKHL